MAIAVKLHVHLMYYISAFADYFLMAPSEFYTPFMDAVREKITMSKVVIEFLVNNQESSYEDLLNKIQTTVPPQGLSSFTEDSLLRHSQWIVDQVCILCKILWHLFCIQSLISVFIDFSPVFLLQISGGKL